jgi:hypothetical protein
VSQLSPPYRLIVDSLYEGEVIPFLGAGASIGWEPSNDENQERPFSSPELANYLAEKVDFPKDETVDLAKVSQYYSLVGGRTPLNRTLHKVFDRNFPITPLHTFLAGIEKPLLIITTNYDDLIERAFKEQGRPYDLVVHASEAQAGDQILWFAHGSNEAVEVSPNKLDIDLQSVTVIYKMHGAVDRSDAERDQYVITEDDYVEFLSRMTRNRAIPAIFAQLFQTRHFLFLGYSLRDWNFRVVLNRIQDARRSSGLTSWGIQRRPSLMEQKFWQNRGVEVYDLGLEEFVRELAVHKEEGE